MGPQSRRGFLKSSLALVGVSLLLGCGVGPAPAPAKVRRIGVLSPVSPTSAVAYEAFRQGLRELGYVEGQNIAIEWRFADGANERLPELAGELVRLKVDVIFAISTPATEAARNATGTIPIVMTRIADPVGVGLVASLAHPGGNVTGLTTLSAELGGKRLQLLKEALPAVSRVAVLWNVANPAVALIVRGIEAAGPQLGIELQVLGVQRLDEVDGALEAAARERAGALFVVDDPWMSSHVGPILDLAAKSRLPVISQFREFTEAGGLMAYGPSDDELFRRAAVYVDRIFKGAKPADLPIERPTKFDLVINLKTAQALGLTIPQSVLAQATEVIQ